MKAWILALMLHLSPPDRWSAPPGHDETREARLARYEAIAADIEATVAKGSGIDRHPEQDAALLVAVTFMESGFAKDVDQGPCYRPRADSKRCDTGMAACIAQIRLGPYLTKAHTHGVEGLSQEDLFRDRRQCLGIAKFMLRRSFRACTKDGLDARMDVYASGRCGFGREEGAKRLRLTERLLALPLDRKTGAPIAKKSPKSAAPLGDRWAIPPRSRRRRPLPRRLLSQRRSAASRRAAAASRPMVWSAPGGDGNAMGLVGSSRGSGVLPRGRGVYG